MSRDRVLIRMPSWADPLVGWKATVKAFRAEVNGEKREDTCLELLIALTWDTNRMRKTVALSMRTGLLTDGQGRCHEGKISTALIPPASQLTQIRTASDKI